MSTRNTVLAGITFTTLVVAVVVAARAARQDPEVSDFNAWDFVR